MTIQQLINFNILDPYEKVVVVARNMNWNDAKAVYKGYISDTPYKYEKLNIESVGALSDYDKSKYYIRSKDGFIGIFVQEDLDEITEIDSADKKEQANRIADKLRRTSYDRWNYALCKQLCKLAGLSDEFAEVDTGNIDDITSVVYDAADILGVTV